MNINVTEAFDDIYTAYTELKPRQIVAWGGSRSSKTFSILQLFILLLKSKPNLKITVWRDTRITCRSTVMDDFNIILWSDDNLYREFSANKTTGTYKHKETGSRIIFEGADQIGKVLGMTQDIAYFNEVSEFSEEVYLQITQRTADTIFCDYNPSKNFFLEKYRGKEDTIFIHSNYLKNAFCPAEIVKQLNSYKPLLKEQFISIEDYEYVKLSKSLDKIQEYLVTKNYSDENIKDILYSFYNEKNGTADEYRYRVYCIGEKAEKPNKIHQNWKLTSDELYNSLPYTEYYGIDFGLTRPTAGVGVKFDGDKTFYIKPLFYKPAIENSGVVELAKKYIKQRMSSASYVVGDSAKQKHIDDLNDANILTIKTVKGNNSVEYGLSLMSGYDFYYVYDQNFVMEYESYEFKLDRYGYTTDIPIKKDDHYMDATRYITVHLIKYEK